MSAKATEKIGLITGAGTGIGRALMLAVLIGLIAAYISDQSRKTDEP